MQQASLTGRSTTLQQIRSFRPQFGPVRTLFEPQNFFFREFYLS